MRFLFIISLLCGCQSTHHQPIPLDTQHKEEKRDWEYLYSIEMKNALDNKDDEAFYFFWPLYLEARYQNKEKMIENFKINY